MVKDLSLTEKYLPWVSFFMILETIPCSAREYTRDAEHEVISNTVNQL
jgi:hypothetical protein